MRTSSGIQTLRIIDDPEYRLYQNTLMARLNNRLFTAITPFKLPKPTIEPEKLSTQAIKNIQNKVGSI